MRLHRFGDSLDMCTCKHYSMYMDETMTSRAVYICDPQIDDDGVVIRAEFRSTGQLIACGIAMHTGRGQADTIRRAMSDLRRECSRVATLGVRS